MIPAKYWSPTKKLMVLGAMAGGKLVEDTATGNPLTFITDVSKPLKSLLIPFTPQQEGSGDPSPQNVRPILPWNGLTVCHGVNLLPENSASRTSNGIAIVRTNGHVKISGTVVNTEEYNAAVTGSFEADGSYCVVYGVPKAPDGATWYVYDGGNRITGQDINGIPFQTREGRNTMIGLSIGLGISINVEFDPVMFKTSEITETDIVFPSPVYGGELEAVSGRLANVYSSVDLGSLVWTISTNGDNRWFYSNVIDDKAKYIDNSSIIANIYCDRFKTGSAESIYRGTASNDTIGQTGRRIRIKAEEFNDDLNSFKSAMTGVLLVYELATPVEIQLTPTQITALLGNNTIWSDADGSMTAVYLKKG